MSDDQEQQQELDLEIVEPDESGKQRNEKKINALIPDYKRFQRLNEKCDLILDLIRIRKKTKDISS